eukprot:CAMPEP_0172173898 /NCGR_PEP_ID=MMETSP1050-20130122/13347_1 /TAXON_ID=233186 /ORGANISM="Cryptomonas curvata, Strain CCAP979/52" /LENGTH=49 /DNA_ID= /DNA_START= /DNA_END= /DNA_ORIENTATION=
MSDDGNKLLDTDTDASPYEDGQGHSETGESDYGGADDEQFKQKKPTVMR